MSVHKINALRVKDFACISGVKPHILRTWEKRYNFLKPERSETNVRYYNFHQLISILNIALLNKNGVRLSRLNRMLPSEISQKVALLTTKEARQQKVINHLIEALLQIDIDFFESLIDNEIKTFGIVPTLEEIVIPFLEKVQSFLLADIIQKVQSDLVLNIIKQKLLVEISNILPPKKLNRTVLLFLMKGEYYEVEILYLNYLLKSKGCKVYYIGQVSMEDLASIIKVKQVTCICTHIISANVKLLERLINEIQARANGTRVVIYNSSDHKNPVPENFHLKKSFEEVKEYFLNCK